MLLTPMRKIHGQWWIELEVAVEDRPGELVVVAELFASLDANIELFQYNRSRNPRRVNITCSCPSALAAGKVLHSLDSSGRLDTSSERTDKAFKADITDVSGLLEIKVRLENRPGTLAGFSRVLADHSANVIYMAYDDQNEPGLAEIAMSVRSGDEVSILLAALENRGYHTNVQWQGSQSPPDDIAGLNPVESFLFKLKRFIPGDKVHQLGEVLRTSGDLHDALVSLDREAGKSRESMDACQVFTNVLQLAATSLSRTGSNFSLRLTGPLQLSARVCLYMLACPTGANGFLLKSAEEMVLIDSSYGLYFSDVMDWLAGHSMDPSQISAALFTHADADHAGWAAPLEERFGTKIYMHPFCREILDKENRAWGSDSSLMVLNKAYTRLINRFTDLRPPHRIHELPRDSGEMMGFKIIGRFLIEDVELKILESRGGHVPGQVFFVCENPGLLFSGDYLIDVPSLSDRTKTTLSLARMLMTSTNVDSGIFGQEMDDLRKLMSAIDSALPPGTPPVRIFPGHGDFYTLEEAGWCG